MGLSTLDYGWAAEQLAQLARNLCQVRFGVIIMLVVWRRVSGCPPQLSSCSGSSRAGAVLVVF